MSDDLVLTGIPRSGTSYACTLFNAVKNTVLVNEPAEVLQILRNDSLRTLRDYYSVMRDTIARKLPIQNKMVNGKFIADTNAMDARDYYVPEVNNTSLVFGSKNTFVYLVCLEKIRKQLPEAVILAFVRHPYDVIASWKRVSFPHLKNAYPVFFSDYANNETGRALARIGSIGEIEIRYALLWNLMANCIIRNIDNIILIRYEDFVVDPASHIAAVYRTLGITLQSMPEIPASEARVHRDALSAAEADAIGKYCAESAGYFGYELSQNRQLADD